MTAPKIDIKQWNKLVKGVHRTGGVGDMRQMHALALSNAEADAPKMSPKEALGLLSGSIKFEAERAALSVLTDLAESEAGLRAENDGLITEVSHLQHDLHYSKAECERVKGELTAAKELAEGLGYQLANMEKFKPLIEAAEKLSDLDLISDDWPTVELRSAALSCLESPESDTVSRGKDDILGERKGKPVICPENGPSPGPEPTRRQR